MESNPYQTPETNVEHKVDFSRSVWWKVYFFVITSLSALGMISFLAAPKAGISEFISLILWVVATVGLYSFVFLKPIYKPNFWFKVLITYIVFSIVYYFITDVDLRMGMSETEYYISNAIGWLLSVPAYYALYALSKPTNPVWGNS